MIIEFYKIVLYSCDDQMIFLLYSVTMRITLIFKMLTFALLD